MILLICDFVSGRLPGDDLDYPLFRGFADIYVRDESGAGIAGVNVWFHMDVYFSLPERTRDATSNGVTDQNGYCYLTVDVRAPAYYGSPTGQRLEVGISASEECINVLNSSGTVVYDTWWIYPQFQVLMDCDGNDIADYNEMPLAEKFCPNLTLHSGDQGVRPVPVEIMDRNGDGQLGWQDVIVDVYTVNGVLIGYFSPSQVYFPDVVYKDIYPYYHPEKVVYTSIDTNNDGCFSCSGDRVAPGKRILHTHFEWGGIGETNPSSWYSHWHNKMSELSSDMRYVKGTTYAHLFKYGSDIVIQYWFFYPFNASANRHEGEAEHINVVVNSQDPSQAQIKKVVYYYHYKKKVKNPGEITIIDGTHPKVYVGGYLEEYGMSGHGTHASYWRSGEHRNINIYGSVETVDGQGLVIDFDNYSNIIILPRLEHVNNGNNNINPYIDEDGNNLNFMLFNAFWGYVLSEPSAFYKTFSFLRTLIGGWTFGAGTWVAEKWFDIPEDVGNIAPAGFPQNVNWEERGY